MASLTEPKFKKAKHILDKYNEQLHRTHELHDTQLEHELREIWGIGYQELKGIMIDLSRLPDYQLLAVRYMESGFPGVVSEFKSTLAKIYGMEDFDIDRNEREQFRKRFWERQFGPLQEKQD